MIESPAPKNKKLAVCVLAMHQSGSSALTRSLNLLGFDLGNPDTLIAADQDASSGLWEQEPIQSLNERMLKSIGREWDTFAPLTEDHLVQLKETYSSEISALVREIFGQSRWIVWKDPRSLLLFDLWKEVMIELGYTLKFVLGIRHPSSVAQSLLEHNGIPRLKGFAVWCAYHARIAETMPDGEISVLDYDKLNSDWRTELKRCFHELGISWPHTLQEVEIDEVWHSNLGNKQPKITSVEDLLLNFPTQTLYEELLKGTRDVGISEPVREALRMFTESSSVFARDVESSLLALDDLKQQHQELQKAYDHLKSVSRSFGVSDTESKINEQHFSTQLEGLQRKNIQLTKVYLNLENLVLHLKDQHIEVMQRNEHLIRENENFRTSLSWKVTAPLRMCNSGLRVLIRMGLNSIHAFPHVWRALRTEGLVSVAEKRKNRVRKELAPAGSGSLDAVALAEKPSDTSHKQQDPKEVFVKKQTERLKHFLASDEVMDFTPNTSPRVAVLLVLYNRAELTLACLRSLQDHAGGPIELIIIDNCSTDQTTQLLDRIQGARIVRNDENRHFLKACNQGKRLVQSEYILFLNNDAQLMQGAIQEALKVFDTEPCVGAVGGKILLLDGTLQEAGSMVWRDGSCQGYGRGRNPEEPEFNFRRDVDFCSGAFLLTPSKLFQEMDGFDERFSPAYYEEVDYCFRLRAKNYKVVYEPRAQIQHFEFASCLREAEAVELQTQNQDIFIERYRDTLRTQFKSDTDSQLKARFSSPQNPRVLYVDDRLPHPEFGSGYPRAKIIVQALVELGFEVTLVPLNFPNEDTFTSAYSVVSPRVEVMLGWGRRDLYRLLELRRGYFDILWVSRPNNMEIVDQCITASPERKSEIRLIYDAEAVFAVRERAQSALAGFPMSEEAFAKKLDGEIRLTRHADAIVSVTESEAQAFIKYGGTAQINVIRHAVGLKATSRAFADREDVLFIGNLQHDGTPNVDSIVWFVRAVWPKIRDCLPGIQLHVIGQTGAKAIEGLHAIDDVFIHGAVYDLETWYDRCRLFVAPTRFSAGIPLKVLDSAAHGLPTVVTEGLADQLGWTHDVEMRVASGPSGDLPGNFANEVVKLYTDEVAWWRVREEALERIRSHFSKEEIKKGVMKALGADIQC